jgi:hypothetical protein
MRAIRNWVRLDVIIVAITLAGEACLASDDGNFEYWTAAGAYFDINKNWGCTLEEEIRFKDGGGEFYYHHLDLGFVYKSLAEWLELGINFKKEYARDSERHWKQENRPHFNLTVKGQL